MTHWTDRLVELRACREAVKWGRKYKTAAAAWRACKRGDWMLWWLGRECGEQGSPAHRWVVLAACACARLSLKHVPKGEDRPRIAIETAERWARGKEGVTLPDVHAAAYAADAAHAAAYAADDADAYAADAAAYASSAAHAAAYAADDADAYAADAAAYAYAADASSAQEKTLARCAVIVRRFFPRPPTGPGKGKP